MGRSNREVGGYRGRRTITDILRFIAVALAIVVVLVLGTLFYLQRYLVYTDDGVRLDLPPFLQSLRREDPTKDPEGSTSPPDVGSVSFVEDPAGSQSEPGPGGVSEPVQSEPAGFILALPVGDVLNGSAADRLAEAGADAVMLEMKDREGNLAWYSDQEVAGRAKVNGEQSANDALRQWNQGDVYTVARVCCFRDNSVPYYRNRMALRQGGNNWRDELGLRWMSPAQEDAQAYIAGLCGELAALGFDEIVLENFAFPIQGRLDRINQGESYNAAQFTQELEGLLDQVEQSVAPYGTKISLWVERDTLAGTEKVSGVTGALLERYAHRIWVREDELEPAAADLLGPAGIGGGLERLVAVTSSHTQDSPVVQAEIGPEE